MASKPHRAVILTRAFRNVGIGAVKTTSGYKSYDGTVWFFTLDAGTAHRAVAPRGTEG